MYDISDKIKFVLDQRNLTVKKLAEKIGMSEQNLHGCFRRNSMQLKDLHNISVFLNVPISYLLQNKTNKNRMPKNEETDIQDTSEKHNAGTCKRAPGFYESEIAYLKDRILHLEKINDSLQKDKDFLQQLLIDTKKQ